MCWKLLGVSCLVKVLTSLFILEQEILTDTYDINYIEEWLGYLNQIQIDTRKIIADKMRDRFDLVPVPRSLNIAKEIFSTAD